MNDYNDYDEYLGLTETERLLVQPLHEAGLLSHGIIIDKENKMVITYGTHTETGIRYIQRRRPMSVKEVEVYLEGKPL